MGAGVGILGSAVDTRRRIQLLQSGALLLGALPASVLLVRAATDGLGANPIEEVTHVTGEFALRFLLAALAVTPLRQLTGAAWIAPVRRTLGLLSFGYATLHLATWVVLDQFFDWRLMLEDVLERRYIAVGFAAFLCLLPLAVTSTRAWIRRLGRRWITLHRLAYVAAVLAILHFLWLVKADYASPIAHAAILGVLLGYRVVKR